MNYWENELQQTETKLDETKTALFNLIQAVSSAAEWNLIGNHQMSIGSNIWINKDAAHNINLAIKNADKALRA